MEEAWQKALRELKKELPRDLFKPYLEQLKPLNDRAEDDLLVLGVQNPALLPHLDGVRGPIQTKLRSLMGRDVRVAFEFIDERLRPPGGPPLAARKPSRDPFRRFNPAFVFDRFVAGRANEMALSACQTIAQSPGKTNPLYIYGDVGLGKTHLLHATAHRIEGENPEFRICTLAVEDFKNEFIQALREKRLLEFKTRFQDFDALFIDDIDTLRGSQEATQEEFFHVFNFFYESGRQIVITSDRPAQDLMISSRLMSRFITGLQVQLGAPDPELRVQYLKFRAKELEVELPRNVEEFIASRVTGNVRVLESALNKLFFLNQRGIDLRDLARVSGELQDLLPRQENEHLPMERIIEAVCRRFSITRDQILSTSRKSEYTRPRHIGMYLGVKYAGLNKSAIARYFNKNDHTTVINAEKNVKSRIKQDPGFALELEHLVNELRKGRE